MRKQKGSDDVFVTDQGNYILDLSFAIDVAVETVAELHAQLKQLTGVVETGFFPAFSYKVITGSEDGSVVVQELGVH